MNMSDGMMERMGSMMGAMGLTWLLVIVLLVLGIAALVKLLFFAHCGNQSDG
ncbi:hypothetical protein [uncultured Roseovarius sp.]|uniref:hypothetical protein n=1 Tax=uncultured Roseovarius sp. TaxID=293344 RepID=UPI00260391B6|nr:hypothetical protein [uncultured Roseovarius sp.]